MRRVRAADRRPPADHSGAASDRPPVQPLARPRHPGVRPYRTQADRQPPARDRCPRHEHSRGLTNSAARLPGSDRPRSRERGSRVRRDPLVGRVSSAAPRRERFGGTRHGKRLVDTRSASVPVPPAQAFTPIRRIGGETGWYFADWLWQLRGFIDLLAGGVGLRRGRRDPDELTPGATIDFWRVEAYEPNRLLRLRAEMSSRAEPGSNSRSKETTRRASSARRRSSTPPACSVPPTGTRSTLFTPGSSAAC